MRGVTPEGVGSFAGELTADCLTLGGICNVGTKLVGALRQAQKISALRRMAKGCTAITKSATPVTHEVMIMNAAFADELFMQETAGYEIRSVG